MLEMLPYSSPDSKKNIFSPNKISAIDRALNPKPKRKKMNPIEKNLRRSLEAPRRKDYPANDFLTNPSFMKRDASEGDIRRLNMRVQRQHEINK